MVDVDNKGGASNLQVRNGFSVEIHLVLNID